MRNLFEWYAELPKFLRRPLWKFWHRYILARDKNMSFRFMNYGYAHLNKEEIPLELKPEDEAERFCINLYHQDVAGINLTDKDILEVGCGRGGGASYISRYLNPKSYVGLDICKKTIKYCNEFYKIPNLTFTQGKAESLPFEDESFDGIVNIESSRCYSDVQQFFHEVYRCLKVGGYLMFSDMRTKEGLAILKKQFEAAQLKIVHERNILPNVLLALQMDNERRKKLALENAPKFLQKSVHEFSGVIGSRRYQLFEDEKMQYFHFLLQKNGIKKY